MVFSAVFLVCDSSAKLVICSVERDKKITAANGIGDLYSYINAESILHYKIKIHWTEN